MHRWKRAIAAEEASGWSPSDKHTRFPERTRMTFLWGTEVPFTFITVVKSVFDGKKSIFCQLSNNREQQQPVACEKVHRGLFRTAACESKWESVAGG